jgi:hyperosmotically inducible periplasmic protein
MKYLALGLVASFAAACASDPPPPPESPEPSAMAVDSADSAANGSGGAGNMGSNSAAMGAHTTGVHATTASTARPVEDTSATVPMSGPGAGSGGAANEHIDATASQPDNSRVNSRDKGGSTLTPMDQGPSEGDRKITQQVRQAVMKDGSLSFTAKNVKIITINGKVTLRGPVKTDQERSAIEAAAKQVAGATQVDNQIEVKK